MAVVDKADRDVVPEFGVPGPISDGVTGSEGGGGRLIKVGVVIFFYLKENKKKENYPRILASSIVRGII